MWIIDKLHKTFHTQECFTNTDYYRKQVHDSSLLLVNCSEQEDSAFTLIIGHAHTKSRFSLKGFKKGLYRNKIDLRNVFKEEMTGQNSAFVLKDTINYTLTLSQCYHIYIKKFLQIG